MRLIWIVLVLILHHSLASDFIQTVCSLGKNIERCTEAKKEYDRKDEEAKSEFCSPKLINESYICFPLVNRETVAKVPCPEYIPRDVNDMVTWPNLYFACNAEGKWEINGTELFIPDTDQFSNEGAAAFANATEVCWNYVDEFLEKSEANEDRISKDLGQNPNENSEKLNLPNFVDIETSIQLIGNTFSMIALFISIFIFLSFKRLRNTRNLIHANLMISLFIRGATFMLQHNSLNGKNGIYEFYSSVNNQSQIELMSKPNFYSDYCDGSKILSVCRFITVLDHWAMTASFFWLLIEGVQLYTLLVVTVLSAKKYFYGYLIFGWLVSWVSVLCWVGAKINYENRGCWEIHYDPFYEWIVRGPILSAISLNFLIFLILIYVIVSKLRVDSSLSREGYRLRLARSTLTLIPLMGTEYIVFAFVFDDEKLFKYRYKIDLFFISFQGFFVSVLFCFMNGEVQKEVRKWFRQRLQPLDQRYHSRRPTLADFFSETLSTDISSERRELPSEENGNAGDRRGSTWDHSVVSTGLTTTSVFRRVSANDVSYIQGEHRQSNANRISQPGNNPFPGTATATDQTALLKSNGTKPSNGTEAVNQSEYEAS